MPLVSMQGLSYKQSLFSFGIFLLVNAVSCPLSAWAYPGERPPHGALEAQCQFGENIPEYCKAKIDRANHSFSIWTPPNRQGAILYTYKLACLRQGCMITGRDFGYIGGPQKYRLLEINDRRIKFISLDDGRNPPVTQIVSILE